MAQLTLPVNPARDHFQGFADAPVTLVEYGDYECPHCGRAHPIVRAVQQAMGDQLRFVFRNFPLSEMHPHAQHAALASESAGEQGVFWEMHHALFTHQRDLSDTAIKTLATQVGADPEKTISELHQRRPLRGLVGRRNTPESPAKSGGRRIIRRKRLPWN
ncbi:MAG: thioredoxin domain-containing protein [bacterium]